MARFDSLSCWSILRFQLSPVKPFCLNPSKAPRRKPLVGGNWMKYCTVAKTMGRGRPIWTSVIVRVRRLRSAAGSINSGRHILDFTMRRALRKRRVFDFVLSCLILYHQSVHKLSWSVLDNPSYSQEEQMYLSESCHSGTNTVCLRGDLPQD